MRDVFATQFNVFKGDKYTKIDFFEMEPTDKFDEKGNIVVEKGEVTRITLPNDLFTLLVEKNKEQIKDKQNNKKDVKK